MQLMIIVIIIRYDMIHTIHTYVLYYLHTYDMKLFVYNKICTTYYMTLIAIFKPAI